MKKILFVYAVNFKFQHVLTGIAPPVGVAWLVNSLDKERYNYEICDLTFVKNYEGAVNKIQHDIIKYSPDVIAVSIRNINSTVNPPLSFLPFLEIISNPITESGIPVIIGGSGFSLLPDECMEIFNACIGVTGAGENLINSVIDDALGSDLNFYRHIKTGTVTSDHNHVYYQNYSSVVGKIIGNKKYIDAGASYPIQTKRGCALNCIYCSYPYIEGNKYLCRDVKDVVSEIEHIKTLGVKSIFFSDSVFNVPSKFCREILYAIKDIDIKWTCYVNPSEINDDFCKELKGAGCVGVQMTIDTLADKTLTAYRKHFKQSDILNADRLLSGYNIAVYYWVNLCGPGETSETLKENIKLMGSLTCSRGWVGQGFFVLPHCGLERVAERLTIYKLTIDGADELVKQFCVEHPQWFSMFNIGSDDYRAWAAECIKNKDPNYWV